MTKHYMLLLTTFFCFNYSFGQDYIPVNPYSNPLWLNPAFSGGSEGKTLYATSRLNTFGDNLFITNFGGLDIPLDKFNGGVGFLFQNYRTGDILSGNKYYLTLAKSINVGEKASVRFALKGGLMHDRLHWDELVFPSTGQGFIYPENPSHRDVLTEDFGTGLAITSEKYDFGFSIDHLNKPNVSFFENGTRLDRLVTIHGSYTFGSEKLSVTPNIVFRDQAGFKYLSTGAYMNFKQLIFGLVFMPVNSTQGSALIGFKFKNIRFAYSYQSWLQYENLSSHEIILSGTLPEKKERKKLRKMHMAM